MDFSEYQEVEVRKGMILVCDPYPDSEEFSLYVEVGRGFTEQEIDDSLSSVLNVDYAVEWDDANQVWQVSTGF